MEAKIQFLKYMSQWPTFGSAFFEVKQTSNHVMPPRVLLTINQNGVSVYDHINKHQIVNYPFNSIVNWTAGKTFPVKIKIINLFKIENLKSLVLNLKQS